MNYRERSAATRSEIATTVAELVNRFGKGTAGKPVPPEHPRLEYIAAGIKLTTEKAKLNRTHRHPLLPHSPELNAIEQLLKNLKYQRCAVTACERFKQRFAPLTLIVHSPGKTTYLPSLGKSAV